MEMAEEDMEVHEETVFLVCDTAHVFLCLGWVGLFGSERFSPIFCL